MRVAAGLGLLGLLAAGSPAVAQDVPPPARYAPEFRLLVPLQQPQAMGLFFGVPQIQPVNPWMSLGLASYGGVFVRNGLRGGMLYGGGLLRVENPIADGWRVDVDGLAGLAGGLAVTVSEFAFFASPVLEPRVALTRDFGARIHASIGVGYLYLPLSDSLSGPTAGIRVQL